jgi:hypothetical protein
MNELGREISIIVRSFFLQGERFPSPEIVVLSENRMVHPMPAKK